MTDEEIRIKIAEACGWKEGESRTSPFPEIGIIRQWYSPASARLTPNLPDYLNSLDAMHEAEEVFYGKEDTLEGAERMRRYTDWLCHLAEYPLRATARQRAEAFIKTLNL